MENYRKSLVEQLKITPKEQRGDVLNEARNTEEYKKTESKYKELKKLDEEAQKLFEKHKDVIEEVNHETTDLMNFFADEDLEKLDILTRKLKDMSGMWNLRAEVFEGKYFSRDYGREYGSDYPGEFSRAQETMRKRKLIYEKLGILGESRKIKCIERINNELKNDTLIPHETFRAIEFLCVSGLSGELVNGLKDTILKSGNANVLRKFLEEFPINFSREELDTALRNAVDKKSLFDITKIIEMIGENNVESLFIEQRDSLLEKAKENFIENRKTIEAGLKNKDFLLHFSGTPYLDSILKNGILSNLDQIETFGGSNSGQGNDLQRITGRLDTVSVLDVFKGANRGEKDLRLYRGMERIIKHNIERFLQEKYTQNPGRIFNFTNPDRDLLIKSKTLKIDNVSADEIEEFRKKYSEVVTVSDMYEERIDPNEKNTDGGYHCFELNRYQGNIYEHYYNYPEYKEFRETFFKEWTNDKQELMDSIKKLMEDTYIESNREEENKKDNIKSFHFVIDNWIIDAKNPTLLIDPSMKRTFVNSLYDGESLVEGSILPDKILGAFANNAHLERVCYNEGKVVFDFKKKEELDEENVKNILFETPEGAIVIKDLYK